ncbi:hypothetical protein INS49_004594 [Diaporthe citri]|uniref:uncharacterized protein n=1 Tax=Diaporthe citri TaxID=83186 RepID=UPI001C823CEA|nr:uncharacterized protein INS49_004594 [Diaporthe citri]KAG6354576.1 hypothetical protein INS49_004594 [Diaporthe citri]
MSPQPPYQLFEEAIDTLNLMFPFQNEPTKKILEKHDIAFYGLGLCGRPRKLLLNDYHYWRGRIADIHQIFQGPPIGIQQLLLDDEGKNFMSTFTFWVAFAAGVVALLGMGLAIASLVYSIKQYELGLKQYEVSIVQACGDSNAIENRNKKMEARQQLEGAHQVPQRSNLPDLEKQESAVRQERHPRAQPVKVVFDDGHEEYISTDAKEQEYETEAQPQRGEHLPRYSEVMKA